MSSSNLIEAVEHDFTIYLADKKPVVLEFGTGDEADETVFTPLDLNPLAIRLRIENRRDSLELTKGNGLSVIGLGLLQIDKWEGIPLGEHDYDLKFIYSPEIAKTLLFGKLHVVQFRQA